MFLEEATILTKISKLLHSWASGRLILAVFMGFVVFEAITLPLLQAAPGGSIESLDTQFLYTSEEAYLTVGSYGDASRFWINIYLSWDVVNPILYASLFGLLISWLFQRSFNRGSNLQGLNLLPVGAALFDLLENITIVIMLASYPTQFSLLPSLSTVFTMSKIILLALSALLILIGLVGVATKTFKKQ